MDTDLQADCTVLYRVEHLTAYGDVDVAVLEVPRIGFTQPLAPALSGNIYQKMGVSLYEKQ